MKRILLATDGTASALDAEVEAARLAAQTGAALIIAHAWGPGTFAGGVRVRLETVNDLERLPGPCTRALAIAKAAGARARMELVEGLPEHEICSLAERLDVDLVVLGARRQHALSRALFGSVSRAVLEHVTRPVMIATQGSVVPLAVVEQLHESIQLEHQLL